MNRHELRDLAEARLRDAEVLYQYRRNSGAFYMAGYSVECAIKACIAKNTRRGDFPNLDIVRQSHTHRLVDLIKVAGLEPALRARERTDPNFSANWALVITWRETARYEKRSRVEARDLLSSISDPQTGVLPWIMMHW